MSYYCSGTSDFQPVYHGDLSPCLWETITASLTLYYFLIVTPLLFFYFRSLSTSSRPWSCRYQYTFYLSVLMICINFVRFMGKFWYNRDVEIFEYYCGLANILSWSLATTVLYKRLQKGLQGAHGILLPPETRPIYTLKTWITSHQPLTIFWIVDTLFTFSNLRYTIRNNYFPSPDITEEELEYQRPLNFYSGIISCCLELSIVCLGILAWREKTKKRRSKKQKIQKDGKNKEISDEYDEGDSNEEEDEDEGGSSLYSGSGSNESYPPHSVEFHSRGSSEDQHKKKHKSEGTGKKQEHFYYDKHLPNHNNGNDMEGNKKKGRGSFDSSVKVYLSTDDPRTSATDTKRTLFIPSLHTSSSNSTSTTVTSSSPSAPKLTKSMTTSPYKEVDGGVVRGTLNSSTASTPLLKGNS